MAGDQVVNAQLGVDHLQALPGISDERFIRPLLVRMFSGDVKGYVAYMVAQGTQIAHLEHTGNREAGIVDVRPVIVGDGPSGLQHHTGVTSTDRIGPLVALDAGEVFAQKAHPREQLTGDGHRLGLLVHHKRLPVLMLILQLGDQIETDQACATRVKIFHESNPISGSRATRWLRLTTTTLSN